MTQPSIATVIVKEWSVVQTKQLVVQTPGVVDLGIKEPGHLVNDEIEEDGQHNGHVEPTVTFAQPSADGSTKNEQSLWVETGNVTASETHEAKPIPETNEDEVRAKPSLVSLVQKPQYNNPTKSPDDAENEFPAQINSNMSGINQTEQANSSKETVDKSYQMNIDQARTVALASKAGTVGSPRNEQGTQQNGKGHGEGTHISQDENGNNDVTVANTNRESDNEVDDVVNDLSKHSVGVNRGKTKTEVKAENEDVHRDQKDEWTTKTVKDKKGNGNDKSDIETGDADTRGLDEDGKGQGKVANAQREFSSGLNNERANAGSTVERDGDDNCEVEHASSKSNNDSGDGTDEILKIPNVRSGIAAEDDIDKAETASDFGNVQGDKDKSASSNDRCGIEAMNDETQNARKGGKWVEKAINAEHPSGSSRNAKCAEAKKPELAYDSTDDQVKADETYTEQQSGDQTGLNEVQATNGNNQNRNVDDDESSGKDNNTHNAGNAEHGRGSTDKGIETLNAESGSCVSAKEDEVTVPNSGHDCNGVNDEEKQSNDGENGEGTTHQNNGGDGMDEILTTNIQSRNTGRNDNDKVEMVGGAEDKSTRSNDRCKIKGVNDETRNARKDEECPEKTSNAEQSSSCGNNNENSPAAKESELTHDSTEGQVKPDQKTNTEQRHEDQTSKHEGKGTNENSQNGNNDGGGWRKDKNGFNVGTTEREHGSTDKEVEIATAESGNGTHNNRGEVVVTNSGHSCNGGDDQGKECSGGESSEATAHRNQCDKTESSNSTQPQTLKQLSQGISGDNPQSVADDEEDDDAPNKTEEEVCKFSSKTAI